MTKKILHIEDDEDIQTSVRGILEYQGYNVITASTGREGLDKLKEEHIDLVLLDMMLPDMNGLEVFGKMREMFHPAKAAFLSTMPIPDDDLTSLKEEGIVDYIIKPFNNEDLIRRVRNILDHRRNVLHIEDDEDTLNLVKLLLETRGYRVLTASNGREGLDQLSGDIDLVLLDVMLPDMSGWTIFQEIRKNPGNKNLKIAFLSIVPVSEEQLMKFHDWGVREYIMKPFDNIDFIKKVDSMIGSTLF
ncbi:MAG: response regulator [Candidatus Altiarchaeales archaeon]|nr:response regulator [Candidatus Altiarchaeales archaeon]